MIEMGILGSAIINFVFGIEDLNVLATPIYI
jgi:hypothetical protein